MEILRNRLSKDRESTQKFLFEFNDPKDRIIRDSYEFFKCLSKEIAKSIREKGRIILVIFKIPPLSKEIKESFEQDLVRSFRFYDYVATISDEIYSVALITLKSPGKGVNIQRIISRIKRIMKKNGLTIEDLNYSFKIIPYDGVDLKALLKISFRELENNFKFPFISSQENAG